jgi:membrane-associated protease RseP (regulator of RpoE activity)
VGGIRIEPTSNVDVVGEMFVTYTRAHVGEPIEVTVKRNGQTLTLTAAPVLATVDGKDVGRLGIILGAVAVGRERSNPFVAFGRGVTQTWETAKEVVKQLGKVFGPAALKRIGQLLVGSTQRRATDPTSIVGGARLAGQAAQAGAWDFFIGIIVIFNVFVGILNLVPLPPLDGGHLAVLVYEKARRRKPDLRKLVPVTALVTGFIVLFALAVSYLDIVKPLPSPFQ